MRVSLEPEELINFANYLNSFSNSLKDDTGNLLGRLRDLGNTWNDPKYGEFADELERHARAYLQKFDQIADVLIAELKGKAQRAKEVHR